MRLMKRLLLGMGTVALVALLLTLLVPKTAHALVAALVQVENTPTNAVPAALGTGAGQLYESSCNALFSPDGVTANEFASCTLGAVPAGYTLFIETVSMHVESGIGDDLRFAFLTTATSATYPHSGETPGSPVTPTSPLIPEGAPLVYVPMTKGANFGVQDLVGTVGARVWSAAAPVCSATLNNPSIEGDVDCTVWGYLVSQ